MPPVTRPSRKTTTWPQDEDEMCTSRAKTQKKENAGKFLSRRGDQHPNSLFIELSLPENYCGQVDNRQPELTVRWEITPPPSNERGQVFNRVGSFAFRTSAFSKATARRASELKRNRSARLIFDEVRAFAFRARGRHFHRNASSKAFDMSAHEAAPAQGFDLFELGNDPKRVSRALADHVESGAKTL